ncbi:MAG: error-prone DNA polymerase [Opitutaceae bacterium]|nr:error-prone DNA polymerase [Cephaloticoccus sp.]MCP5530497.1 error-prone DNA polymerase [Opitutaceae bacterium]
MKYIELHARTAFSFLRGASNPEDIVSTCAHQDVAAFALCERNGVYSAVRGHLAAKEAGLRHIVGAEVTLDDGSVVPLLVATQTGYRNLCRLLTKAKLRSPKGGCAARWDELAEHADGLFALTGDEDGPVRRAWRRGDAAGAGEALSRLAVAFPGRLHVELQRHRLRDEDIEESALVDLARAHRLPLLATNGVLYDKREKRRIADAFTCLRHKRTLDTAGRLLAANAERAVKSPALMSALFADLPEAIENTSRLAEQLTFNLHDLGYRFPDFAVPQGETVDSYLRKMTYFGAYQRYGSVGPEVRRQLDKELGVIARLGFAGYFLVVWDLCSFCRDKGILVQGRGSAANSAVCYSLGITAVDPIGQKLLFERFLSDERTGWPDIDLDLPSRERRETVIQEVYKRYPGRAAMTANVITYRGRNTMREMGKVLGFTDDVLDRYTSLFAGGDYPETIELQSQLRMAGVAAAHPRTEFLIDLVRRCSSLPRHLGQHSGGMVLCAGRLDDVVPLENAAMENRTVIEWDKTDCEDMGIVKVDLLGLGMMAAVEETLNLCEVRGVPVDFARMPKDDPATYDLMCRADTIGLFQVESRAQMATLPRFKPRNFYDLAMQVAIIRPGPIQGEAVHPLIERRAGRQPVTFWDSRLEPILGRTYGVVLFQEQLLRIAMELANFTAGEADELRRSIDFKRNQERMKKMQVKLQAALAANHTSAAATERIVHALSSFALYSFPESHALSFALIAYTSAYLKTHRPAEFYVGLLNAQPMGFYSPATLVQDARRHGIAVRPLCVMRSGAGAIVEGEREIRIGFRSVHGLRAASIQSILETRSQQSFDSVADFIRRTKMTRQERHTLASAGALNLLAGSRRHALWQSAEADAELDLFANVQNHDESDRLLTPMTIIERVNADFATVGLTAGEHPMKYLRAKFPELWRADELALAKNGTRVRVGGSVICRQRPGTAKGVVFVSLEDETGVANGILYADIFEANRLTVTQNPALVLEGPVQSQDGVVHVKVERVVPLCADSLPVQASHDFH